MNKHFLMPCGECNLSFDMREMFVVQKPTGKGFAGYDPRPKTPCGGRMGLGGLKFRRFVRTEKTLVCVGCSLKYSKSTPPREFEFRERARRR